MASLAFCLSACASLPPKLSQTPSAQQPETVTEIPANYAKQAETLPYIPLRWWEVFNDPVLDELLDKAIAGNLDLAEATARLSAVQAEATIAGSILSPQLEVGLDGGYSNAPGDQNKRFKTETLAPSLNVSYELDLWGRLRNRTNAAEADFYAAAADLEAARLAVIAETITHYFDLVDTRSQINLLQSAAKVLAQRTEQTESRYRGGLVSSFEIYQIRQEFRNVQAALPESKTRLSDLEGQLAILTGGYVDELETLFEKTLSPRLSFEDIPLDLPASLLSQRPDVSAAALRLEAARFRIGERRAEQYPAISLSGNIGTTSDDALGIFNILDNWVLGLGAGLTAPLRDGGRIKANIAVADAEYSGAAAAYARSVITAYQEVRAAISAYDERRKRYKFLYDQLSDAKKSSKLQSSRFSGGLGEYSDYLDAEIQRYQIEAALSTAGRDVALARLAIHRALGGDWTGNKDEMVSQLTFSGNG